MLSVVLKIGMNRMASSNIKHKLQQKRKIVVNIVGDSNELGSVHLGCTFLRTSRNMSGGGAIFQEVSYFCAGKVISPEKAMTRHSGTLA